MSEGPFRVTLTICERTLLVHSVVSIVEVIHQEETRMFARGLEWTSLAQMEVDSGTFSRRFFINA